MSDPPQQESPTGLLRVTSLLMLSLLISCGAGSGGGEAAGVELPPARTPLTATANGASNSVPLTLTVQ